MLTINSIQADLDTARQHATRIEKNLAANVHNSWIDRNNAYADLEAAHRTITALEEDLADAQRAEQQAIERIQKTQALAQRIGNPTIAALLHIVYGVHTLTRAMTEVRLIDPNGYTVPGSVRTVTPATDTGVRQDLRQMAATDAALWAGFGYDSRDYRVI